MKAYGGMVVQLQALTRREGYSSVLKSDHTLRMCEDEGLSFRNGILERNGEKRGAHYLFPSHILGLLNDGE
jgi:hypothetical protein